MINMRQNLIDCGLEFIEACCEAQTHFEAWAQDLDETKVKAYSDRVSAIRSHLNDMLHEASQILNP